MNQCSERQYLVCNHLHPWVIKQIDSDCDEKCTPVEEDEQVAEPGVFGEPFAKVERTYGLSLLLFF